MPEATSRLTKTIKRNMTEKTSANITQLLTSFDSFIKILENPEWTRTAKVEDIKTAFKLSNFIEKSTDHFKSKNTWEGFLTVLVKWWRTKERTKIYSDKIYVMACDELLIKFFRCSNMSQNTLDIAVRVYTSLFPKKRLEEVLTKIFLDAGNLEGVTDYLKITITDSDSKYLEYQLKLQQWDNLLQIGEDSNLKEEIKDMIAPYNVETFLYLLIGILSITGVSDKEQTVQNIVIGIVVDKMLDRSILTKQFWFTLFKNIDKACISSVCTNFKAFLTPFLNFIVYTGSMMKKVGQFWKSDPNICFYPDIDYDDILYHVYHLCKSKDLKPTVVNRLIEAKESTGTDIWEQILCDIGSI